MSNPNRCEHCGHKQTPDDGWCYMFRMKPTQPCVQHTLRTEAAKAMRLQIVGRMTAAMAQGAKT